MRGLILLHGIAEIFLPMFSSRAFMVSWLIFKSFIHFEFILVDGISWCSSFIFFACSVQFSQHHLLNRLSLLHCMLMLSLSNMNWSRDMGFFLGSLLCFIDLCVCSYASIRLFWLQWPCNTVWYQVLWSLPSCSSFSRLLRLFGVIFGSV